MTLVTEKQDSGTLSDLPLSRLLGCGPQSHNGPNRLMRRDQRQWRLIHPFPDLVAVVALVQQRDREIADVSAEELTQCGRNQQHVL